MLIRHCDIVTSSKISTLEKNSKLKDLQVSILDLYTRAISLPEVEPIESKVPTYKIEIPQINFKQWDEYWIIFDPFHNEKPVGCSLADDVLDIYRDVKEGLILYQRNEKRRAIWDWKLNFEIHWGNHAVNAIRALHTAILDNSY